MEQLLFHIQKFGLTDNEAKIYVALSNHGPMNGYELAKKAAIARGNIYTCLNRLIEKEAIVAADGDKFVAVPLEVFIDHFTARLKQSGKSALALMEQSRQRQEEAQIMSISGTEAILNCCRTILASSSSSALFMAAFPKEFETLSSEIQGTSSSKNILCFGKKPVWLDEANEHLTSEQIEAAQGGRLLIVSCFPQALIAVIRSDGTASGIWAWNRYLASATGLYVAHEILIMKMWPLIPKDTQEKILSLLTDISSRIGLAGVVDGLPLQDYIAGVVTPRGKR